MYDNSKNSNVREKTRRLLHKNSEEQIFNIQVNNEVGSIFFFLYFYCNQKIVKLKLNSFFFLVFCIIHNNIAIEISM